MSLTELSVTQFTDQMASSAPTPGGGSAAAAQGAQGAALSAMVCALTLGKERYAAHQALVQEKNTALNRLKDQLLELVEKDVQAFRAISAVYAMAKGTEEEKAARAAAMDLALQGGVQPPLETMELCLEALEHTGALVGRSNVSASSDLGVAAVTLRSAIRGAWLNVVINLGGIRDPELVRACRSRGERVLERALPLADDIYERVLEGL